MLWECNIYFDIYNLKYCYKTIGAEAEGAAKLRLPLLEKTSSVPA